MYRRACTAPASHVLGVQAKSCPACKHSMQAPLLRQRRHLKAPAVTHAHGAQAAIVHVGSAVLAVSALLPNCVIQATVAASAVPASTCGPLFTSGWPVWTVLAACGALGQMVEHRTALGKVLSAPLLSMALGAAATSLGVLPLTCAEYDAVWNFIMPVAAALYLLEADLKRLLSTARPALAAFVIGAAGTVVGTFLGFKAVGHLLGGEGYKMAAALCASYVGGSINFAATAHALLLQRGLMAACMAADNLAMAVYLAVMMSVPAEGADQTDGRTDSQEAPQRATPSTQSLTLALAVAACTCSMGVWLANRLGFPPGALTITAMLCSLATGLFPDGVQAFAGAEGLAGALMMFFFATIGACAGLTASFADSPALFTFIILQLAVHVCFTLGIGKLLRLPMKVLLIASNANVGGPATAAAMAASRGWPELITPAIMTGGLGYAVGTALGCGVGACLATA